VVVMNSKPNMGMLHLGCRFVRTPPSSVLWLFG